jgi:hypothetical protein
VLDPDAKPTPRECELVSSNGKRDSLDIDHPDAGQFAASAAKTFLEGIDFRKKFEGLKKTTVTLEGDGAVKVVSIRAEFEKDLAKADVAEEKSNKKKGAKNKKQDEEAKK